MLILLYKFGYFVVKFLGEDCVQKFFFLIFLCKFGFAGLPINPLHPMRTATR